MCGNFFEETEGGISTLTSVCFQKTEGGSFTFEIPPSLSFQVHVLDVHVLYMYYILCT